MPLITSYQENIPFKKVYFINFITCRKNFGTVWISILMCKFNLDQYKRSLIMLNEKVLETIAK